MSATEGTVRHLAVAGLAEQRAEIKAFTDKPDLSLVVYGAEWCGPCRALEPVLDKLAAGGLPVLHVDVDAAHKRLVGDIESVPTLRLYRAGEKLDELAGALPLSALRTWMKPHQRQE